MARLAGIELQDWQQDVIEDWSAVDEDGQFVHRRNGGSIPRQAGKSVDGIAWATYLVAALGATVLWTDHNYSTTVEMLRRFREIFGKEANDKFAKNKSFNKLVSACNNKTAQEAIFLKNGGSLHFSTRTKSANLGYSFDVVFYDEAQELSDEQQQAILPTTTSGSLGNPQAIYLGTPPRVGGGGEVFTNMRADAIAGGSQASDLSWWEWGVDEIGDVHDESRWYGANPSLGRVANISAIRAASRSMSVLAFSQEYLGYWLPKSSANSVIEKEKWEGCATSSPPESGLICYGVKFSPDGQVGTLSACIRPKDGPAHVEVVENRSMSYGLSWFVEWLLSRKAKTSQVTVDGMAHAEALKDELVRKGMPERMVVRPKAADMASACSTLLNAVNEGKVTHFSQPALDESALLSRKRKIGSGGGWGFADNNCDSTLIESCALAYWGAMTTKRNTERKQRTAY